MVRLRTTALSVLLLASSVFGHVPMASAQPGDIVYLNEIRSAIENNYYSPNFDRKTWSDKVAASEERVRQANRAEVDKVFQELVESLKSNHTYYVPPEAATGLKSGGLSYGGIGISFRPEPDGSLRVEDVFPGGPADRGGMKAGQRVTAVDGKKPEETPIVGEPGTPVTLTLTDTSKEGRPTPLTLEREKIFRYEGDVTWEKRDSFGYMAISSFTEDVPDMFDLALSKLGKVDGLIIDLRGNPGGLIYACAHVGARIGAKTIGQTVSKDKGKEVREDNTSAVGRRITGPVVVLVDGESGSSSEILAETVKDLNLGKVLGKPTAAQVQTGIEIPLSNGAYLMVTVGLTLSPSGFDFTKPVEPDEILPDVVVRPGMGEGRDNQVDRALDVLRELTAKRK